MEAAHSGYTETKGEIERTDAWMKERIGFLQNEFPSVADPEQRLAEVAALCREAEAKSMMLDSLDGKVAAIGGDLEPAEQEQLASCLKMISANQKVLSKLAKEVAKKENAMAEDRKRLDDDFEDVGVWVQTKSSELLNTDQHLEPLKAFAIEKKVGSLKKAEAEIKAYEEDAVSRLRRNVMSLSKTDATASLEQQQQQPYSSDLKDIETSFENLKRDLRARISALEERVEPRRDAIQYTFRF